MHLSFAKEGPMPPLNVKVFDKDDISGNDDLGTFIVDLTPCRENPCSWSVNQLYDVADP